MFSLSNKTGILSMLARSGLIFIFTVTPSISHAQTEQIISNKDLADNNQKVDFYTLEYKRSGRTIKIEKPPIAATSTPFIINNQISLNSRKKSGPVDDDYLTTRSNRPLDIHITNQTCEIGSILNTASFTICSNEKETITFIDADNFRYAIQDSRKAIHKISPHSCETISVIGDDSDLQFDCSGVFGLTFQVILTPSGQKSYFGVPIRGSAERIQ